MKMEVTSLRPGLWRWIVPHPEWKPEKGGPGGWDRAVGCVYYEPPPESREGVILFDPLAPVYDTEDWDRFWEALDRDVERIGKPVAVLLGNYFHQRSAQWILDRYRLRPGAEIWASAHARGHVQCELSKTIPPADALPGGVKGYEIDGLEKSEMVYYLPYHQALIVADALIGIGGGKVRVPPLRWAENTPEGKASYEKEFRPGLRRLLDLPIEMLLVSHGEPVLANGRAALSEALAAPAWGD